MNRVEESRRMIAVLDAQAAVMRLMIEMMEGHGG